MFLIAGGTGFVGSAVVEELKRRGLPVGALGRDAGRVRQRFGAGVEARAADVTRPEQLVGALQGAIVVINSVQFPNMPIENARKGWTFERVDFEGTRNLVEAAKQAGVKRFVYVSGVGAGPAAEKHWFRFKWQAEQYLATSGLEWSIVRPTWVFGPGDHSLNRLIGFARFLPFIPSFGDGLQAMQPVFIDDVGRVLADAAMKPEAANQMFELGGPEIMTMNDVLNTALEVMGKKRPIIHQPVALGKVIGRLAAILPAPPLSVDAIDFITSPAVADTTHIERVLTPKLTPLRQGLETYLRR